MITLPDLETAIARCQGEENPNAQTCIKLAAFYIIRNEMYGGSEAAAGPPEDLWLREYSYDAKPADEPENLVDYDSGTDFSRAIDGKPAADLWPIMDELLTVLQATNPRLFDGVMRKIAQI